MKNKEKKIKKVKCPECRGRGGDALGWFICEKCNGTGKLNA